MIPTICSELGRWWLRARGPLPCGRISMMLQEKKEKERFILMILINIDRTV